jgi:hypothetical protein
MNIGDKVICINDLNQHDLDRTKYPGVVQGEIYIVRGKRPGTGGLYLKGLYLEILADGVERGFLPERFRKIDDDFSSSVLKEIEKKIDQEVEELV